MDDRPVLFFFRAMLPDLGLRGRLIERSTGVQGDTGNPSSSSDFV
jgi:hypothetical protein